MVFSTKINLALFIAYFLLIPSTSYSQEKPYIYGRVVDSKSGEPLNRVNVYLANTMKGAFSDSDGIYKIQDIRPGIYNIIVSYAGYETLGRRVKVEKNERFEFDFSLRETRDQYVEFIDAGKKPKNWNKHFKLFKRNFIGTAEFSNDCKILNPSVMGFVNEKKAKYFKAVANNILDIENKALGYKIRYSLREFRIENDLLYYRGEPYFEEMTPKNDKEMRKWEENREEAYNGSLRHFLKSLVDATTTEDGFELILMDKLPPNNSTYSTVENPSILFNRLSDNEFELNFKNFVRVVYLPGMSFKTEWQFLDSELYGSPAGRTNVKKKYPTSFLVIRRAPVLFDNKGILSDPHNILSYGAWPSYRIAELLPREYTPRKK